MIRYVVQYSSLPSLIITCLASRDYYSSTSEKYAIASTNTLIQQLPEWFKSQFNLIPTEEVPVNGMIIDLNTEKKLATAPESFSDFQDFKYALDNTSRMIPYFEYDYFKLALYSKDPIGTLQYRNNIMPIEQSNTHNIAIDLSSFSQRSTFTIEKWQSIIEGILASTEDLTLTIFSLPDSTFISEEFKDSLISYQPRVSFANTNSFSPDYHLILSADGILPALSYGFECKIIYLKIGLNESHVKSMPTQAAYILESKSRCFPCSNSQPCNYFQCHFDISVHQIVELVSSALNSSTETIPPYLTLKQTNIGLFIKTTINEYYTPVLFYSHVYRMATNFAFLDIEEILPNPMLTDEASNRIYTDSYAIELFLNFSSELFRNDSSFDGEHFRKCFEIYESTLKSLIQNYNYLNPISAYIQVRKQTLKLQGDISPQSLFKIYEVVNYILAIMLELIRKTTVEIKPSITKGAKNAVCDN